MSPDLTARFMPVLSSHEKKLKIAFTTSTTSLHCDKHRSTQLSVLLQGHQSGDGCLYVGRILVSL